MRRFLLACALLAVAPTLAYCGSTVIASTSTYGGDAGVAQYAQASKLPAAGVYQFSLSVATGSTFSGLSVYLQQQGVSGAWYTLNASTFTSCSAACWETVFPDVYEGGAVRPQWSVTSGSATFTVTAVQVVP